MGQNSRVHGGGKENRAASGNTSKVHTADQTQTPRIRTSSESLQKSKASAINNNSGGIVNNGASSSNSFYDIFPENNYDATRREPALTTLEDEAARQHVSQAHMKFDYPNSAGFETNSNEESANRQSWGRKSSGQPENRREDTYDPFSLESRQKNQGNQSNSYSSGRARTGDTRETRAFVSSAKEESKRVSHGDSVHIKDSIAAGTTANGRVNIASQPFARRRVLSAANVSGAVRVASHVYAVGSRIANIDPDKEDGTKGGSGSASIILDDGILRRGRASVGSNISNKRIADVTIRTRAHSSVYGNNDRAITDLYRKGSKARAGIHKGAHTKTKSYTQGHTRIISRKLRKEDLQKLRSKRIGRGPRIQRAKINSDAQIRLAERRRFATAKKQLWRIRSANTTEAGNTWAAKNTSSSAFEKASRASSALNKTDENVINAVKQGRKATRHKVTGKASRIKNNKLIKAKAARRSGKASAIAKAKGKAHIGRQVSAKAVSSVSSKVTAGAAANAGKTAAGKGVAVLLKQVGKGAAKLAAAAAPHVAAIAVVIILIVVVLISLFEDQDFDETMMPPSGSEYIDDEESKTVSQYALEQVAKLVQDYQQAIQSGSGGASFAGEGSTGKNPIQAQNVVVVGDFRAAAVKDLIDAKIIKDNKYIWITDPDADIEFAKSKETQEKIEKELKDYGFLVYAIGINDADGKNATTKEYVKFLKKQLKKWEDKKITVCYANIGPINEDKATKTGQEINSDANICRLNDTLRAQLPKDLYYINTYAELYGTAKTNEEGVQYTQKTLTEMLAIWTDNLNLKARENMREGKGAPVTVETFLASCQNVVDYAREHHYKYGCSTAENPTTDGVTSCDRLVAKALYDLGFTDQPRGGITVGNMARYLRQWGFIESHDIADAKRGSILLVRHGNHADSPGDHYCHAFVTLEMNPTTWVSTRYDHGSNGRISSVQPLKNVPWGYVKRNYLVFNIPDSGVSPTGEANGGGIGQFSRYNLDETTLVKLARLCAQEQGSPEGCAAEASLMCNHWELNLNNEQGKYPNIYEYVRRGGWFAKAGYYMDYGGCSQSQLNAVRAVFLEGKRTLPLYVDEHDCMSDISSISGPQPFQQGQTVLHNRYGSTYTFYCYPAPGSDPFGYTQRAYNKAGGVSPQVFGLMNSSVDVSSLKCIKATLDGKKINEKEIKNGVKNYTRPYTYTGTYTDEDGNVHTTTHTGTIGVGQVNTELIFCNKNGKVVYKDSDKNKCTYTEASFFKAILSMANVAHPDYVEQKERFVEYCELLTSKAIQEYEVEFTTDGSSGAAYGTSGVSWQVGDTMAYSEGASMTADVKIRVVCDIKELAKRETETKEEGVLIKKKKKNFWSDGTMVSYAKTWFELDSEDFLDLFGITEWPSLILNSTSQESGGIGTVGGVAGQIASFLKQKGLKNAQIAGILGNLAQESGGQKLEGINPGAIQYPAAMGSDGVPTKGGIGIIQWTGGRKTAMANFAKSRGKAWQDLDTQLEYLWLEMFENTSDHWYGLYNSFMSAATASDACHIFLVGPEAGGQSSYLSHMGQWAEDIRKREAERAYQMLQSGGFIGAGERDEKGVMKVPYYNQGESGGYYQNGSFTHNEWMTTSVSKFGGRTVHSSGCGFCASAMAISYLTGQVVSPFDLFVNSGAYEVGSGMQSDGGLTCARMHNVPAHRVGKDKNAVDSALRSGHPVMVHVGPGPFTKGGHYILLIGITPDGRYAINDSGARDRTYTYNGCTWDWTSFNGTTREGDDAPYTIFGA